MSTVNGSVIPTLSTKTPPPGMEKDVETTRPAKLVAVAFITPITFGGVSTSLRVGINVDSVTPCRLDALGRPVTVDPGESAVAICLRRAQHDRIKNREVVAISVVPLTNVSEFIFEE